ncbi:MAG: anaerobic sulfatase maturase [Planctomycetota bacterium]
MEPFTLLIKPSGSDCNADCTYCFYKDRAPQFGRGRQRMSGEIVEALIRDYMSLDFPFVGFAWQGGEPTLMGLDFYRKVVELQNSYGKAGQQVSNKLQTNGMLLDDEWCRFLHEHKFLAGISVDGPKEFHDYYRVDHSGAGTFDRVMKGVQCCKEYDVEFNTLVLLNNLNAEHPDELFDFFIQNDMTYLQFIPCVEPGPASGTIADFSITPEQYGDFLCRVFDRWLDYGPQRLNIREFDSILTYYVLGRQTICAYQKQCAGSVVIEHTGDAFCCEFFMEPQWRLGNILETPIEQLAACDMRQAFARAKQNLCSRCLVCSCLDLCRGGCVKDRARVGDESSVCASYLCEGYRRFFDYAIPKLTQIAADVNAGSIGRHVRAPERIRWQIRK